MQHLIEEWRIIPKTNRQYSVSNLGNVKSNGFYDSLKRYRPSKILKPINNGAGYLCVALGKGNLQYIHRLVAICFLGLNEKIFLHVNHKDGNKSNNIVSNLELVTRSENDLHKKRNLEWHRFPIVDLETGIFYSNCKELFETFSHTKKWSYGMWKSVVQGVRLKNKNKRFLRL